MQPAPGLQSLINSAVKYVKTIGLRFYPEKTKFLIKGTCPFDKNLVWVIQDCVLNTEKSLKLGNNSGKNHVVKRLHSCRGAFFSLQGIGLCKNCLDPEVLTTCKYGINAYLRM